MFKSFPARYSGKCGKCGLVYAVGDSIFARRGGHAYHAACAEESKSKTESNTTTTETLIKTYDVPVLSVPNVSEEKTEKREENGTQKNGNGNGLAEMLAGAIGPYIKISSDSIREEVALLEKRLHAAQEDGNKGAAEIEKRLAALEIRRPLDVTVRKTDAPEITIKNVHKQFRALLSIINAGRNVFLWGAPGGGKSTAGKQVADGLGRAWEYQALMPTTPESRVFGFIDANGKYVETPLYRAYRDGKIMILEEVDNSSAMVQAALNTMLENGHASFPCGMVPKHENFVLIATGNTCGRGATLDHQERRSFDSAFADRFVFLRWEYDETLEDTIALGLNPKSGPWIEFVRAVRKYAEKHHPRLKATPRSSFSGATLLLAGEFSVSDIAEMTIFKGIDSAVVSDVLRACPLPTEDMKSVAEVVL